VPTAKLIFNSNGTDDPCGLDRKLVRTLAIDPGKSQQNPSDTTVHIGHREFSKQFGGSFVQHGEPVPAGLVCDRIMDR